jgi:hypothetical protein
MLAVVVATNALRFVVDDAIEALKKIESPERKN